MPDQWHRGHDPTAGDEMKLNDVPVRPVSAISAVVVFGDDGTPVAVGTVPAGARVTSAKAIVGTAFDDSGSDLIDIGVSGAADKYASDLDVSSTGIKEECNAYAVETADQAVIAQYDGANSDASAGEALVVVEYIVPAAS